MDLSEAGEDKILQQLAANAASPYHKHARLLPISNSGVARH